jgi:hypothetical protein
VADGGVPADAFEGSVALIQDARQDLAEAQRVMTSCGGKRARHVGPACLCRKRRNNAGGTARLVRTVAGCDPSTEDGRHHTSVRRAMAPQPVGHEAVWHGQSA